jgi:hypothetical protein
MKPAGRGGAGGRESTPGRSARRAGALSSGTNLKGADFRHLNIGVAGCEAAD